MTVDAIFLVLIIFATLLFNEVIIINAFGLNKHTKKGMLKKEKLELQSIQDGGNDDSDDEDNNETKEEVLDTKDKKINAKDYSINESIDNNDNNSS